MDRSMVQILSGLLPTLDTLPPELTELAVSLVAQSRSKASSLKAEEEIARSYACAHIACERSKQTLGLPKLQPRPPCPPRIYQKLHKYLDAALPAGTPRKHRLAKIEALEKKPAESPTNSRTPLNAIGRDSTPSRKSLRPRASQEIPSWTMPAIRRLCAVMKAPAAPPHVLAGVSSILTLPAPYATNGSIKDQDKPRKDKVPALIIAVYMFVSMRLLGKPINTEEYKRSVSVALETVNSFKAGGTSKDMIVTNDIDDWLREIRGRDWLRLDWFLNVPEGVGANIEAGQGINDASSIESDEEYDLPPAKKAKVEAYQYQNSTLQPGLGTMMQDKVDYLSEAKRLEYRRWEADIRARIDKLEREEAIDISS